MNPDLKSPVTIENLLQLKRTERPNPGFWTQFDQEIRAKQLVAIMEKRPSWWGLPKIFTSVIRHPAPLGAAAALGLTTLGFHEFHLASVHRPAGAIAASAAAVVSITPAPAEVAPAAPAVSAPLNSDEVIAAEPARAPAAENAQAPEGGGRLDGQVMVPGAISFRTAATPRAIAANFSLSGGPEAPAASGLFSLTAGFSAGNHLQAMRSAVIDPLTRMAPPSSEHRARILTMDGFPVTAPASDPAAPASDRFVSRLSDDRLYQSVSRYGGGGDHFSVKF